MKTYVGKSVAMNSFFSTTAHPNVASKFLQSSMESDNTPIESDELVPIMFEIDSDPSIFYDQAENTRPFVKFQDSEDDKGQYDKSLE